MRQIDGVFQGQLGAAADGVMGGVSGVTHQHHGYGLMRLSVRPMHPVFANHPGKLNPNGRAAQMRGIAHQCMAAQVFGKQLLTKCNAVFLRHLVQSMRTPHFIRCFHNERGGIGVVLVGMGLKPAVLGLFKGKGECVKGLVGTQPDKTAMPRVNLRLIALRITVANATV